jgi:hypothetical protein
MVQISLISCPRAVSWRAQYCALPLASIPTTQRGSPRMKLSTCARRQLPAHYHSPAAIRSAHREHTLCQVDPDPCNFHPGPSSLFWMLLSTSLAHREAVYKRAGVHTISPVSTDSPCGEQHPTAALLKKFS